MASAAGLAKRRWIFLGMPREILLHSSQQGAAAMQGTAFDVENPGLRIETRGTEMPA